MLPSLDRVMVEMQRRWRVVLEDFGIGIGEKVVFLLKKKSGERCFCYSVEKGEGDYRCKNCFGVGYVGGYDIVSKTLDKDFLKMFIRDSARELLPEETGEEVDYSISFWFLVYPLVNTGDVVVRVGRNKRYIVDKVEEVRVRGVLVRQKGSLKELEPSHIIYSVSVPLF